MKSKMKKTYLIGGGLIIAGSLVTGLAFAKKYHHHDDYHGKGGKIMKFLDTNEDEMISQDEFTARAQSSFTTLDANADGVISNEEFLARPLQRFAALDGNQDGMLALDELPKKRFKGGRDGRHKNSNQGL